MGQKNGLQNTYEKLSKSQIIIHLIKHQNVANLYQNVSRKYIENSMKLTFLLKT